MSFNNTKLKPGESTNCTIKGNFTDGVNGVDLKVEVGDNLTISNLKIDDSVNKLGFKIEQKFKKNNDSTSLAEGMVSAQVSPAKMLFTQKNDSL